MASASPGKRLWKCPECGNQFELSTTQLDPIACDACLDKMKTAGRARTSTAGSASNAGPIGFWSALPEIVKLSAVLAAFLGGLWFGYLFGHSTASKAVTSRTTASQSREASHPAETNLPAHEPTEQTEATSSEPDDSMQEHPPAPGRDYHWVRGRLLKDGSRGKGYWAKNRSPAATESKP